MLALSQLRASLHKDSGQLQHWSMTSSMLKSCQEWCWMNERILNLSMMFDNIRSQQQPLIFLFPHFHNRSSLCALKCSAQEIAFHSGWLDVPSQGSIPASSQYSTHSKQSIRMLCKNRYWSVCGVLACKWAFSSRVLASQRCLRPVDEGATASLEAAVNWPFSFRVFTSQGVLRRVDEGSTTSEGRASVGEVAVNNASDLVTYISTWCQHIFKFFIMHWILHQ